MEKGIFEKNRRKNRYIALAMTVLFHAMILGGLWYANADASSSMKTLVSQIFGGEDTSTTDESYAQP